MRLCKCDRLMTVEAQLETIHNLVVNKSSKSYHNFIHSLNSDMTKRVYHLALVRFMTKYNIQDTDQLVQLPVKEAETLIIDRIIEMQKERLSVSSINMILNAMQHFYSINDIVLNWKKVRKFVKTDVKRHTDEAYTHEDISKLLSIADLRFRMVFLLFASTGIRVDALHSIKLKDLKKIDLIYKIVIYEGFKEEYFALTTPECAIVIDQYLDYRRRSGEVFSSEDTFLLRESFDNNDLEQVKRKSRPVSTPTIRNTIRAYLVKAGIRVTNNYSSSGNKKRHTKAQVHGFRKFFTNQLVNSKVNPEIREMLLGHKIGLASAYYRPQLDEFLTEHSKAINLLTINEENRLKKKVTELESKQSEIDLMKYKHEMEMKGLREQMDKMESTVSSVFSKIGGISQLTRIDFIDKKLMKKYACDPDTIK
jgi:integrase